MQRKGRPKRAAGKTGRPRVAGPAGAQTRRKPRAPRVPKRARGRAGPQGCNGNYAPGEAWLRAAFSESAMLLSAASLKPSL